MSRPWQIGVGRLVSTINWSFSGSMLIFQRVPRDDVTKSTDWDFYFWCDFGHWRSLKLHQRLILCSEVVGFAKFPGWAKKVPIWRFPKMEGAPKSSI